MDIQQEINKKCMGCMNTHEKEPCEICGFNESSYEVQSHILKPRTILNGKYMIGKILGEGGFGITYIGLDLNLGLKLAIKEYYPSGYARRDSQATNQVTKFTGEQGEFFDKGLNRFLEEARNVAKFNNAPGIVRVVDFFRENATAYMVMEYVEGITLKQYLKQNAGKIGVNETIKMMNPVISSLALVHKEGMIHRDISPDNIMIDINGNMKLIDFGAAREYASEENKSMSILLKPGFAPEEQYRTKGNQGPWSDVYALCATMYKMMTGITPVESLERRAEDTLRPLNEVDQSIPKHISDVIWQGMAILMKDRIQDMRGLYQGLYAQELTSYAGHSIPVEMNSVYNQGVSTLHTSVENNVQGVVNTAYQQDVQYNNKMYQNGQQTNTMYQAPQQQMQQNTMYEQPMGQTSSKNKNIFIVISGVLALCLALVVGITLGTKGSKTDTADSGVRKISTSDSTSNSSSNETTQQTKQIEVPQKKDPTQVREELYAKIEGIVSNGLSSYNYGFYFCDVEEDIPFSKYGDVSMGAWGLAHMYLMAEVGNRYDFEYDTYVDELIKTTMTTINNEKTNELIDAVGIDNINNNISAMGMSSGSRFSRRMAVKITPDNDNLVTANDMGLYLKNLYNDRMKIVKNDTSNLSTLTRSMVNPKAFTNDMMYYMENSSSSVRYGIPRNIENEPGVTVYNKIGKSPTAYNDIAIVKTSKGTFVICILTEGGRYNDDANGKPKIDSARIAKEVYDAYMRSKE